MGETEEAEAATRRREGLMNKRQEIESLNARLDNLEDRLQMYTCISDVLRSTGMPIEDVVRDILRYLKLEIHKQPEQYELRPTERG